MCYNNRVGLVSDPVVFAPVAQLDRAIASDAMCRAFESHQACQKTAPQSTAFDCGACFFVVSLERRTHQDRICNFLTEML